MKEKPISIIEVLIFSFGFISLVIGVFEKENLFIAGGLVLVILLVIRDSWG